MEIDKIVLGKNIVRKGDPNGGERPQLFKVTHKEMKLNTED